MKINKDQILKSLNCCLFGSCLDCPYEVEGHYAKGSDLCAIEMKEKAILITSELAYECTKLTDENERLRAEIDRTEKALIACDKAHNALFTDTFRIEAEAKYDTVRKMHSEIKDRCIKGGIYPAFVASTIDQIAKEISEGGDKQCQERKSN